MSGRIVGKVHRCQLPPVDDYEIGDVWWCSGCMSGRYALALSTQATRLMPDGSRQPLPTWRPYDGPIDNLKP